MDNLLAECGTSSPWFGSASKKKKMPSIARLNPAVQASTPSTRRRRPVRAYHLTWELDAVAFTNHAEREDGIFPLLTNDKQLTAEEVLRAYKRQPIIENSGFPNSRRTSPSPPCT